MFGKQNVSKDYKTNEQSTKYLYWNMQIKI